MQAVENDAARQLSWELLVDLWSLSGRFLDKLPMLAELNFRVSGLTGMFTSLHCHSSL
jgi:hypothetical protein